MAITENVKEYPACANAAERVGQWEDFFENVLGADIPLTKDENGVFWLDGVGFSVDALSSEAAIRIHYGAVENVTPTSLLRSIYYSQPETIYYQYSKNKDAVYVYDNWTYTSNLMGYVSFIIAKNDSGKWCVLQNTSVYTSNGEATSLTGAPAKTLNPFSAVKMPDMLFGGYLPGVYKILSANTFTLQYTYINIDGKPCRVASVMTGDYSKTAACYAFPVSD